MSIDRALGAENASDGFDSFVGASSIVFLVNDALLAT